MATTDNYIKVEEITNATTISRDDKILFDTGAGGDNGTKIIKYSDFMKCFVPDTAAAHNAIFRGKDLTNVYTKDQIYAKINAGTFEDLFIGDYFDVSITTQVPTSYDSENNTWTYTSVTETVRHILAGFDTFMQNGDSALTRHHAVIVPKNTFTTNHPMNHSHTTVGAYKESVMRTDILLAYQTALETAHGNHLLNRRVLVSNAMDSTFYSMAGANFKGASKGWEWMDSKLDLLSEVQVYGSTVLSSSFYDVGTDNLQLPLFRLDPSAKVCGKGGTGSGRNWWWLKAVASAAGFCDVDLHGSSYYDYAGYSRGVRPLFVIG